MLLGFLINKTFLLPLLPLSLSPEYIDGVNSHGLNIVVTTFPADVVQDLQDFILWQPDATEVGVEAIYVMVSEPLDSGRFTRKQLDKKYLKHARDFGVSDTKKNRETLTEFRDAIDKHLADKGTIEKGTYLLVKDSKVFFNSRTNNVVVISKDNSFVSGWKLEKNTQQYKNYIEKGILR
ncbi:colicin D domain-containing protein [Serratia proteamaculans]|uniref:colicin D domain-containing protein n=1 Tax=Serratia proteamaculans TaxID=28151 RepID=UPI0039BE0F69